MIYKINEIFHSIQGEGYNTGLPVVFIRLAECNLKCGFCDTNFSVQKELTEKEILEMIVPVKCGSVVLTGGEPLLQDLQPLCHELKLKGYDILIETNGTIDIPDGVRFDWVTMSPKADIKLTHWDEAKIIVSGTDTIQRLDSIIKNLNEICPSSLVYLQPCWDNNPDVTKKAISNAVALTKRITGCKLSLQMHKLIGIK